MTFGLLTVLGAGVLTLATPCVLPMVPVYFALVAGASTASAKEGQRRALLGGTTLFFAGFAVVFTLLGLAASSVGAVLVEHRTLLVLVSGALVMALGLKQLGVFRVRWLDQTLSLPTLKTRFWSVNAWLLGVVFALGWTPCVGPILGSVLTFAASSTTSPAEGALYLFAYALGVGLPLMLVALVGDRALGALKRLNRHLPKLERVTGSLMVLGGLVVAFPAAVTLARADTNTNPKLLLAELHPELQDRPLLLAFRAQGCPACARMAPHVEQLTRDCLGKKVGVVRLDVADPHGSVLARHYGIGAVPTVVLLDTQRAAEGVLVGEQGLADLRAAAASLLKTACASQQPRTASGRLPNGSQARAGCDHPVPSATPLPSTCSG
jgi:cytochrome c-type biogenesis protein